MNYILILPQHPLKVLITLLLKPGYLQFHVGCSSGYHAVLKPKYILALKSTVVSVGTQWLQHYKIGGIQYLRWREFIAKQWTLHQKSAVVPVSMADIKYLRTLVDELVVQGRDHAATHIHVYCPFLYHHVPRSTFGDPKVYTKKYTPRET